MRFLTAGESHGPGLVTIVEGLPRGVSVSTDSLLHDLRRRQAGYGRGPRAANEPERIELLAGVRAGRTTGGPVAILLRHKHWETWRPVMHQEETPPQGPDGFAPTPDLVGVTAAPTSPRPGHADLAGAYKYGLRDLRDVIERASARETAARTAAGSLARSFLGHLGMTVGSWVSSIGRVGAQAEPPPGEAMRAAEVSPVRAVDRAMETEMMAAIDAARAAGDTLGGTFVVAALGVPIGLGSYTHWDRRLDGRLAAAVMSIPSVKGVEIGEGFALGLVPGSQAHDAIYPHEQTGFCRRTNRAGGLEGGLSNGEPVVLRAVVKPVPTLYQPLPSIDLATGRPASAAIERSDTCVVPAAAVVAEAMVAWVLADATLEKFGGDTLMDVERALEAYRAGRTWWHDV